MKKFLIAIMTAFTLCGSISPIFAATLPSDVEVAAEGNTFVSFDGTYSSMTKAKILEKINKIRKEACDKGYINPSTGKKLTSQDYVPIKWSRDLESMARLRAAEATIYMSHDRPNGLSCFSVEYNGTSSWAENLAWNWSGMEHGIDQWYEEKNDWVKQNRYAVTGHYTSMIDPEHCAIGIGTFSLSEGGYITTAAEFSFETDLDETKSSQMGKYNQLIEIPKNQLKSTHIDGASSLVKGTSSTYTVKTTYNGYTGKMAAPTTWTSSNPSLATVDSSGKVTAKNQTGTVTISASVEGKTYQKKITITKKLISNTKITVKDATYTGKSKVKPKMTVKYGNTTLKEGRDYKLQFVSKKNNKNTGAAYIKVVGINEYQGTKQVTYYIVPKTVSISSVKASKKAATVKYKKVTGASGYQIAYKKKGTSKWSYKSVSSKTSSKKISKLTKKKTYEFKVRAYKTVGKTKHYGAYSKVKTCKIK